MHAQFVTVAFVADGNGIVQILGIFSVNGHHGNPAQIQSSGTIGFRHLIRHTRRLI